MRKTYFSDKDFGKNRIVAVCVSLLMHAAIVGGLWILYTREPATSEAPQPEDLSFGSSGGGGAEQANEGPPEFGPQQAMREDDLPQRRKSADVELIQIHIIEPQVPVENAMPVVEKPKEKPKPAPRKYKPKPSIIAENLPIGHLRHAGQGPGSGGGAGGGSGGGIGARQGYSIDWGGTGGRKLLSGAIPRYPKGTDKQMAVVLKFAVLPDGTVDAIFPSRRTDELLERAAIVALQTWRFEPLPSAVSQKSQSGKVTFSFKLE